MRNGDAEALARLLETGPADDGEGDVELRALAALARSLDTPSGRPDPAFKAELRAVLVEEARAQAALAPRLLPRVRNRWAATIERWRYSTRLAAGGLAAAVALSSGGGVAIAAERSLPDGPLYGVKLALDEVRATLTFDDVARGERHLDNAQERVEEAERVVALGDERAAADALRASATSARKGAAVLIRSWQERGDERIVERLSVFAEAQRQRVASLARALDGDAADAARGSLVVLERIEARLVAIGACGPCPGDAPPRSGAAFDFSDIPAPDEPFVACPCEPEEEAAPAPTRSEEPAGDTEPPREPEEPEQPPAPEEPPSGGPVPDLPPPAEDVDDVVNGVLEGIVTKGTKTAEKSVEGLPRGGLGLPALPTPSAEDRPTELPALPEPLPDLLEELDDDLLP